MKFEFDIDDGKKTSEMCGWLQCILVTVCLDRPDVTGGRIMIRNRAAGWHVGLTAYGWDTVISANAGGATLEAAADLAVEQFSGLYEERGLVLAEAVSN